MKWKDLSLKERKQIYDSVRVNNPGATYFDIKQQFDSIPTYEDGKDESVAASFSLPEVTIYPQNRFGDIARTQGYETAKNWKKVKEGTTAGINTFINSPHAQFVQTMLPLPDGLEHLGSGIKQVKQFIKSESDRTPLSDTNVKSIPKYQDGKGKTINKADLPPEYRTGTPVDENMILEYMRNPTSNKMVKNQYDLYRNKNEYIDRLNKLIPMEILMPLGGAGFVGHELNKE